jgi:multiple sugar transport system permease protein
LAVTTSVTAGFALAVLDVPFRRSLLFLTLVTMLIPVTALAMPLYVMVDKIGLNDNILGLILASAFFPFGAFLSYLYFSASLPVDLIGMGRIDGLGDLGIYRHLWLPSFRSSRYGEAVIYLEYYSLTQPNQSCQSESKHSLTRVRP